MCYVIIRVGNDAWSCLGKNSRVAFKAKKKNVVLPSATDPSQKFKLEKIAVMKVPNFVQIWYFFRKMWKKPPNFVLLILWK